MAHASIVSVSLIPGTSFGGFSCTKASKSLITARSKIGLVSPRIHTIYSGMRGGYGRCKKTKENDQDFHFTEEKLILIEAQM
jgi:hypothetical protein